MEETKEEIRRLADEARSLAEGAQGLVSDIEDTGDPDWRAFVWLSLRTVFTRALSIAREKRGARP
jgi:hypothetical protein